MRPADNIERFVKETKITTNPKASQEVLNDLLSRMDKAEGARPAGEQPNIWRVIMKSNVFRLAAAAAVVAIVAIVGMQFVGGTSAYAQIVQQIKAARTVTFTLIRQSNSGDDKTIKVDVAYKEPGHLRTRTPDDYIAIVDGTTGKMISIVPQGGYTMGDLGSLIASGNSTPFADIEAMKALPAEADRRLGSKEIDSTECDGYQVTQGDMTIAVWLEAKSGDLVQAELKYASAPGMDTTIKNIQLDVPLEDSLFSLTPPAGYKEMGGQMKSDTAMQTEEKFVEWLGWWANANVDATFPPMVTGAELAKVCMEMAQQGKLKGEYWQNIPTNQMFNALLFVATLPEESNWRYTGNGVKINTPDTPIFWYRPAGSELYHVFYADLSVRDVAESELPK